MMYKHQKFTRRESKHSRDCTALQLLGNKRNWANGVMIGGMIGGLHYLNRIWKLDQGLYERAVWALECIQIDIDGKWYEERDKEKLQNYYAQQQGEQHAQQGDVKRYGAALGRTDMDGR